MIRGILGKKVGMTQCFDPEGRAIPVTVVEAGPCTVLQVKTTEKDGYSSLQLGFGASHKNVNKPMAGHLKKSGAPKQKFIKEFRLANPSELKPGDKLDAAVFNVGERVDVTGVSKGHGFAGGVKRHHYRGGPKTHGSMFHRAPGSIGASAWPSRVFKGQRLPGHMGAKRITVQSLEVVKVEPERNLLLIKGSVPGPNGGFLVVRKSVKGS